MIGIWIVAGAGVALIGLVWRLSVVSEQKGRLERDNEALHELAEAKQREAEAYSKPARDKRTVVGILRKHLDDR